MIWFDNWNIVIHDIDLIQYQGVIHPIDFTGKKTYHRYGIKSRVFAK